MLTRKAHQCSLTRPRLLNVFVFGVGPFQGGSRILGSGRFSACARPPLTGIFGESLGGGYNAEEFKKAGFDALVVKGKSSKPLCRSDWDGVCHGVEEPESHCPAWNKDRTHSPTRRTGQTQGVGTRILSVKGSVKGKSRGTVRVVVNGKEIRSLDGSQTTIQNGDCIMIYPLLAGG